MLPTNKTLYYLPRFQSEQPIKPQKIYRYQLNISGDRETNPIVFFRHTKRYLNGIRSKNYAVAENGEFIYSLSEIDKPYLTTKSTYEGKTTILSLELVDFDFVSLDKKDIYEQLIVECFRKQLLTQKTAYSPFNNGFRILIKTYPTVELYRFFYIQPYIDDQFYFHIFCSLSTKIISRKSLLELYRENGKIDNISVIYKYGHLSKPQSGVTRQGFSAQTSEDYKTREGLVSYYKQKYNMDLTSPEDDFAVEVIRGENIQPCTYLASTLYPITSFDQLSALNPTLIKDIRKDLFISIKDRMAEITTFMSIFSPIKEFDSLTLRKNQTNFRAQPQKIESYNLKHIKLSDPKLIIGNNLKIDSDYNSKRKIFNSDNGFYSLPTFKENYPKLKIALISATSNQIEDKHLKIIFNNLLNNGFYSIYPYENITFECFHYRASDNYSELDFTSDLYHSFHPDIALVVVDGKNSKIYSEFDEYTEDIYPELKKAFSDDRFQIPSQMISIETARKFYSSDEVKFYAPHVLLGIIGKLGGIPYILDNNYDNIDMFIGLDVGKQEKHIHIPACAAAFTGDGKFISFYAPTHAIKGEKVPGDVLKDIFDRLYSIFKEKIGRFPETIVIHRDGFSHEDDTWYENYFKKRDTLYKIIEIKKSGASRIDCISSSTQHNNPVPGDAFICEDTNESILITSRPISGGSPNPLNINLGPGTLKISLQQAVQQVYSLTKINASSITSSRLPITTFYADKINKKVSFIPTGKFISKLYFI